MTSHAARLIVTTIGITINERLDPSMAACSFRDNRGQSGWPLERAFRETGR
jgi:hypothetical protein